MAQHVVSNTMRVPRFLGKGKIDFVEKAVPTPGPGQLLIDQHHSYLRQIITHTYHVSEIQQAFDLFFQGETGKVVVEQ